MTVTVAEGRMLSGEYRGSALELYTVSTNEQVGDELVHRRNDELIAPVAGR